MSAERENTATVHLASESTDVIGGTANAASDSAGKETQHTPPPPPDGGYGWVCTVCTSLINAHTWGINSSYGVFLAHYLAEDSFPGASHLEYAFVGGLSISIAMLVAPLATMCVGKLGTHPTLYVGIVFQTAGLIGASFAQEIWQLFLSQGIAFGVGMGFLFVASVGIPSQWFSSKRSLVNGISAAGSGFGGLTYSLAAGAMLQTVGLGWCLRVLGIVSCAVNTICSILLRDRNAIIGSRHAALDLKLFKRPEFLLLNGYGFFSMLGYIVLIFSLAAYGNDIGLNASQASVVAAIFNLGQGLGRPPTGYFSDSFGRINMAGFTTFLSGLFILVIWIFANSYAVLVFYALIGGTVAGTFWATISPVSVEVVGLKDLPAALNLEWLVIVLPCTFSQPIALQIAVSTGDYLGAQLLTGFMYLAAASCILCLRGWKGCQLDELAETNVADVSIEKETSKSRRFGSEAFWKNVLAWRKV